MKIHFMAALSAVVLGLFLKLDVMEWGLIIFSISLVIITETINTAVEKTVDLITEQYHPLAKIAKNLAAGAVLISAINAVVMACLVFGKHLA